MVKIRISYDKQQDGEKIIKILSQVLNGAKIKRIEDGKHKKIYIDVK